MHELLNIQPNTTLKSANSFKHTFKMPKRKKIKNLNNDNDIFKLRHELLKIKLKMTLKKPKHPTKKV
jgi:hypothetical protein